MKIKKEEFVLRKFKILPSGGLQIHWKHQWFAEEQVFVTEYSIKQEVQPHPDLLKPLEGMNAMIATIYGFGELGDKEFNALSALLKTTGVTVSGSDELSTVILVGQKEAGTFILNLVTHQILLQGGQYGFEQELEALVDDLSSEIYQYLFENKFAQTELLLEQVE